MGIGGVEGSTDGVKQVDTPCILPVAHAAPGEGWAAGAHIAFVAPMWPVAPVVPVASAPPA